MEDKFKNIKLNDKIFSSSNLCLDDNKPYDLKLSDEQIVAKESELDKLESYFNTVTCQMMAEVKRIENKIIIEIIQKSSISNEHRIMELTDDECVKIFQIGLIEFDKRKRVKIMNKDCMNCKHCVKMTERRLNGITTFHCKKTGNIPNKSHICDLYEYEIGDTLRPNDYNFREAK